MSDDPDFALLRRWRQGDRSAGDQLVKKYYTPVRRYFTNSVDDDAFQDLTNETFRRLTVAKTRFEGSSSVRTFLFTIARRVLYDHLRKRYRDDDHGFDPMTHTIEDIDGASPSKAVVALDQYRRLLECLRALPVETKMLLELYYWHDCTAAQLAEVHSIEPGTVRSRVHTARTLLARGLAASADGVGGSSREAVPSDEQLERALRDIGRLLVSGPGQV